MRLLRASATRHPCCSATKSAWRTVARAHAHRKVGAVFAADRIDICNDFADALESRRVRRVLRRMTAARGRMELRGSELYGWAMPLYDPLS